MTLARLALVAGASWLALSPASAAAAEAVDSDESIRTMHEVGTCITDKARFKAVKVLALPPGSAAETKLLVGMATDDCLEQEGTQLRFKPKLLRGVLAETLFEKDFGAIGGAPKRKPAVPFSNLDKAAIEALPAYGRRSLSALDFAACVVARAPAQSVALLATAPTSDEEGKAIARLTPHLGPCIQQGARLEIVKPQLRGFVAEAAYRAAFAAIGKSR